MTALVTCSTHVVIMPGFTMKFLIEIVKYDFSKFEDV